MSLPKSSITNKPHTNQSSVTSPQVIIKLLEGKRTKLEYEAFRKTLLQDNERLISSFVDSIIVGPSGEYRPSIRSKVYFDRTEYEGQFLGDKREGRGILHQKNGEKYLGEWKGDIMHGEGVYVFSNGERYEGWFKMGVREGFGKYTFFNGNYYEGEWREGTKFIKL